VISKLSFLACLRILGVMLLRLCRGLLAAFALLLAGCDYTPPKPVPLRVAMITRGHGDRYRASGTCEQPVGLGTQQRPTLS